MNKFYNLKYLKKLSKDTVIDHSDSDIKFNLTLSENPSLGSHDSKIEEVNKINMKLFKILKNKKLVLSSWIL